MDGGNSWFEDTRRREVSLRETGLHYVSVGISAGEEGVRHGPINDARRFTRIL
jgi:6-phosphogluconate dehydrogenase